MGSRILIIEDSLVDQKLMRHSLTKEGFQDVYCVASGEEGLVAAQTESPSVAIVDTHLPGIDGYETCRRLKGLSQALKVVIVTGLVDAVDAGRARESGADDYCAKTAEQQQLLKIIKKWI